MICRRLTIINKLGLHARAAAKFVNLASTFESAITLTRNGKQVNGKSILGVMMLAAGLGAELELKVDGRDESEAADRLEELVKHRFGEPE